MTISVPIIQIASMMMHKRDELQQHTQPHQLLRRVRRAAAHHVDEAEQQHDSDAPSANGTRL